MPAPRLACILRLAPVVLLLLGAVSVRADPPARVARVGEAEGSVSFSPAGDNEWTDLQRNRPLTRGDRLWADRRTRAELQVGSSIVRLDGHTRLDILALDDQSTQLSLTQGSVYVHVRSLPEGENFEIDTPNLAYRAVYPGDYRIDVDPAQSTTRVTIDSGTGAVFGEGGQTAQLSGGQQITFRGRALAQVASQESPPEDAFDRWAMERNRREDQSIAARYVPREIVGYQQLDPYGQWRRHDTYGAIWFPQGMPATWAPYRDGHWDWIAPWGWTWIDDAPWGFAPFHYGRWALVDDRWAWVPGRLSVQPVYAPALVAFVGGSASELAWFPLAPREPWQPPYAASALYISNVNRNIPLAPVTAYAYQRRPEALSAIALAEFDRGRPTASGWWRAAANMLTSAPIVAPPPLPGHRMAGAPATKPGRGGPPAVQPVVAQAAPPSRVAAPAQAPPASPGAADASLGVGPSRLPAAAAKGPISTVAQAPAAAQRPQRTPRAAAPPRAPEVARNAPAQRLPAPTQSAAFGRAREQHASRERARHELTQSRAGQTQRVQLARREPAGKAKRQAQAHRQEQLRLAQWQRQNARTRADEQLRRDMHASQVAQARRAAERDARALREQRLQREAQTRRVVQERDAMPPPPPAWEQRPRQRARPDLRQDDPASASDVWQRGLPLVNPGPTS